MLAIKSESTISSLECSLCLETFQDPRMLPCGHTFCLRCLQKVTDTHLYTSTQKCAFCRQEFGDVKLQELPKNFAILNVIASMPTITECGSVGNGETHGNAEFFCIECWEPLCSMCYDSHKRTKFTRNHITKKVAEVSEADIMQQNKCKLKMCSKHPKEELKLYCKECDEVVCVLCNMTSHSKHSCLTVDEADDIFTNKIKSNLAALKREKPTITKQAQYLDKSLCFVSTAEEQQVTDVKSFFNEIKTQMRTEFEAMFNSLESYEKETLQNISDIISTEKRELENMSIRSKENLIKINHDIAQHEDYLSLSKSTIERTIFIKKLKTGDNYAPPKMPRSLQYKVDGVAQWKNNFKQWLHPIQSSMTQINSTSPTFQANFVLSPLYPKSYAYIKTISLNKTQDGNALHKQNEFFFISLHKYKLLMSCSNTSVIYIYDTIICQTTELQIQEKICNATWLPNGNIIYSSENGCKIITKDGNEILKTEVLNGFLSSCADDIITCVNENGICFYSNNGTNVMEPNITVENDRFFWKIIQLNKNTFWSIETTNEFDEFRIRSFQISEGLSDINWQDIDTSPMGPDIMPIGLAYDNIATVFILTAPHGYIYSFSNGIFQCLTLSDVPADFDATPMQIEFDNDNHLLYVLLANGDIKVASIKYE